MATDSSSVLHAAPSGLLGNGAGRSEGLREANLCSACGAATFPLSGVLRSSANGGAPLKLSGALPDKETISRWLRPPDVPTERPRARRDIWGPPFSLAILVFVVLLASVMVGAILGYWFSIPIAVLAMLAGLVWIRRAFPHAGPTASTMEHERALALRAWDRRMEVWERLTVCSSCGLLTDPVTGRTAQWHSVPSLFV